jgi:hypothetical protein
MNKKHGPPSYKELEKDIKKFKYCLLMLSEIVLDVLGSTNMDRFMEIVNRYGASVAEYEEKYD